MAPRLKPVPDAPAPEEPQPEAQQAAPPQPLLQATFQVSPGRVGVTAFPPDITDSEVVAYIAAFLNHVAQARMQQLANSPAGRILGPNGAPIIARG